MATLFSWYPKAIYTGNHDGYILRGIVAGHPKLPDGMFVHTSQILTVKPTDSAGQYCVQTCKRTYTLEMRNCQFSKSERFFQKLEKKINLPDWLQQWKKRFSLYQEKYCVTDRDISKDWGHAGAIQNLRCRPFKVPPATSTGIAKKKGETMMAHTVFVGKFPKEICKELKAKGKAMVIRIYEAGHISALREVENVPGALVLGLWSGDDHVVLRESMRKISLRQDGESAGLEDYLIDEGDLYTECRARIAIRAAHLLCEYLFPGNVYTKQNLKEQEPQKTLHFLQDLFPEEPIIDTILQWRMNNHAIWNAIMESSAEDPSVLYEHIALWPAGDILMREQEQWRHSIEEPDNDTSILSPASIYQLDENHPANINSSTGAAFFLLCLRRELLKQFDFTKNPGRETVRAAMLLNSMRNGGGTPPGTQPLELPEQVHLRLFMVEWEVLVQLLAFLAKLPADDVRKETLRLIRLRGEEARKQLALDMGRARLEAVRQRCKRADYAGTLQTNSGAKLPYSTREVVLSMRHSAEYQRSCLAKHHCHERCMALLRELSEQGIYFPGELHAELCPAGHYALLLAVKAIACPRDRTGDRILAAQFINQYLREGVLPPDIEEN